MATPQDVIDGLTIINKYWPGQTLAAEHDILYAGGPGQVTDEEKAALEQAGWHYVSEFECWGRYT